MKQQKKYYNLTHVAFLAHKYHIHPITAGYMYGILQNHVSFIRFERILEELRFYKDDEQVEWWDGILEKCL